MLKIFMSNPNNYLSETITITDPKTRTETILTSSWKDIKDIFKFGNTKPYVILAPSGCGKTTLCYDILYEKAKEATAIYYVSETTASATTDIISNFPNAIRSRCTMENLIKIWQEITENRDSYYCSDTSGTSTNSTPMNSLAKIYNKLVRNGKLTETEKQWKQSIAKAYPKLFDSKTVLDKNMSNIIETIGIAISEDYYQTKKKNTTSTEKANNIAKDASNLNMAFCQETMQRLIVNIMQTHPETLKSITADQSLSTSEMNIINGFYSEKPKSIFIIDDCTDALEGFTTNRTKITGLDGSMQSTADVYKSFMTAVLTRARHANCLVCIFTHKLSVIPSKDSINNVIVLSASALDEMNRSHSVPEQLKQVMKSMVPKVFNNPSLKFHFVYYNYTDDPTNVYISKATLRKSREDFIEFNPICQKYYDAYDKFNNNDVVISKQPEPTFDSAFKINDDNDDTDDSSDELI